MINKLIRIRVIEIIVVTIFVICTIPIWQRFDTLISKANVTTLDSYSLDFTIDNQEIDILTVNNKYYINKNYKIYLVINQNINENIEISINNKSYLLSNFNKETKRKKHIYTLIDDYITAGTTTYEIDTELRRNNIEYFYIFEEKSIF